MDLRIGVSNVARELNIELDDSTDVTELRGHIETALGSDGVLWVEDRNQRQIGVPVDKLAYVEIGAADGRRIGFATN